MASKLWQIGDLVVRPYLIAQIELGEDSVIFLNADAKELGKVNQTDGRKRKYLRDLVLKCLNDQRAPKPEELAGLVEEVET